jgi:hypothetical protein
MKTILAILFTAGLFCQGVPAQAKQRKVLLLQIAALQTYIGYAKKGYTVVKNGLNFIGDVKNGEVNLHSDYFRSLQKVNPKVRNYVRIAEIISLQVKIIKTYKNTLGQVNRDDLFHGDELDYIEKTFEHLIANCNETLDQLLIISTDAGIELTDDQRIKRVDDLYITMMDDYSFCENFSQQIRVLLLSKAKEENDVKQGRVLFGL